MNTLPLALVAAALAAAPAFAQDAAQIAAEMRKQLSVAGKLDQAALDAFAKELAHDQAAGWRLDQAATAGLDANVKARVAVLANDKAQKIVILQNASSAVDLKMPASEKIGGFGRYITVIGNGKTDLYDVNELISLQDGEQPVPAGVLSLKKLASGKAADDLLVANFFSSAEAFADAAVRFLGLKADDARLKSLPALAAKAAAGRPYTIGSDWAIGAAGKTLVLKVQISDASGKMIDEIVITPVPKTAR